MGSRAYRDEYRAADVALVRAAANPWPSLPPCPDLTVGDAEAAEDRVEWLRQVWSDPDVAEALGHASSVLNGRVRVVCDAANPDPRAVRRATLTTVRYLQRLVGRATPFGLFAGVAPARFASGPRQSWGTAHRAVARASAEWLSALVARLESCPRLRARLPVIANNTLTVRGDQLVVPYRASTGRRGTSAVDVSIRYTGPIRVAIAAAHDAILFEDLAAKVRAEYPAAATETLTAMLAGLVGQGALITSLHAPSTVPDALGHVMSELDVAAADTLDEIAELVAELRWLHAELARHNEAPASEGRDLRADVAARMGAIVGTSRHPLAIDLRLDATLTLPAEIAREVEVAAALLTRLSAHPTGLPMWGSYHQRFYERYGIGSLVPLLDMVADSGIGWPDGYPGSITPLPRTPLSARDEILLDLAQTAALDRRDEIVLNDELIAALRFGPERLRPPSHVEVAVRVYARDQDALAHGRFRLEVVGVSRAAGVMIGRFLSVLDERARTELSAVLSNLPAADADTSPAQLSFPPLDPMTAHVTRALPGMPVLISLAEHHRYADGALSVEDLAVGCDGRRLYLAVPRLGRRLEAAGAHALNLVNHTPPLARLLIELSRAQYAQVTRFFWGAAEYLPYLPRLRYGRVILSPARWRVQARELPNAAVPFVAWDAAFNAWRVLRRTPARVYLTEGDRLLPLDLEVPAHRALLRNHLDDRGHAVLAEAPSPNDSGWCDGRPHELAVPLISIKPAPWPRLPKPHPARILPRGHGHPLAVSSVLLASLYGDVCRQNVVLARHLPDLLDRLGQPAWWFMRYRDPDHHLRLRLALTCPEDFATVARTVSAWVNELHHANLLREVVYPTHYREIGRWGDGSAWAAVEEVFRADSQAILTQLRQPAAPHRQALLAAHATAITAAFTGGPAAGMRWIVDHLPANPPDAVPRAVFTQAVRLANPDDDYAALRAVTGGAAIVDAWATRDRAIAAYRAHLPGPHTHGINPDAVLDSLMHTHYVRSHGIDFADEAICHYLTRAAALAWTVRHDSGRP